MIYEMLSSGASLIFSIQELMQPSCLSLSLTSSIQSDGIFHLTDLDENEKPLSSTWPINGSHYSFSSSYRSSYSFAECVGIWVQNHHIEERLCFSLPDSRELWARRTNRPAILHRPRRVPSNRLSCSLTFSPWCRKRWTDCLTQCPVLLHRFSDVLTCPSWFRTVNDNRFFISLWFYKTCKPVFHYISTHSSSNLMKSGKIMLFSMWICVRKLHPRIIPVSAWADDNLQPSSGLVKVVCPERGYVCTVRLRLRAPSSSHESDFGLSRKCICPAGCFASKLYTDRRDAEYSRAFCRCFSVIVERLKDRSLSSNSSGWLSPCVFTLSKFHRFRSVLPDASGWIFST